MPKPEEVLIVEDENGEIIREIMKDSDAIILYKSMRETLIYLTNLDHEDTQNIMLEKLANQVGLEPFHEQRYSALSLYPILHTGERKGMVLEQFEHIMLGYWLHKRSSK